MALVRARFVYHTTRGITSLSLSYAPLLTMYHHHGHPLLATLATAIGHGSGNGNRCRNLSIEPPRPASTLSVPAGDRRDNVRYRSLVPPLDIHQPGRGPSTRGRLLEHGRVISWHGHRLTVEDDTGKQWAATPMGRRLQIVTGDHVRWERARDDGDGTVFEVLPRFSQFQRANKTRPELPSTMCSNIDQVVIVCAPQPRLNPFLIDRYLSAAAHMRRIPAAAFKDARYDHSITAGEHDNNDNDGNGSGDNDAITLAERTRSGRKRKGHEMQSAASIGPHRMRKEATRQAAQAINNPLVDGIVTPLSSAIICCNKVDLLDQLDSNDRDDFESSLADWQRIGYRVVRVSARSRHGLDELTSLLSAATDRTDEHTRRRCSIFVGQSGTGKSSILNQLSPGLGLITKELIKKSGQGRHTTTASTLYHLPNITADIIDSPGLQSYAPIPVKEDEIHRGFIEFVPHARQCRFSNCRHHHEPEHVCGVKQAITSGLISERRYESYLRMLSIVVPNLH